MDWTQNGPNSEWTEHRMDSTPTGLNPDWDSTPNGLNPDWDSTPNGLNSEWDSTSTGTQPRMDSTPTGTLPQMDWTQNGTQPRISINLEWYNFKVYIKIMDLKKVIRASAYEFISMLKKLEPNKLKKNVFYCSWNCSIRGWEEFEVESHSVLSLFYVESHSKFSPFCVESHSVLSPF
jgi:hypothetical protein